MKHETFIARYGVIFIIGTAIILTGAVFLILNYLNGVVFKPTPTKLEEGLEQEDIQKAEGLWDIEIVADNLKIPWEVAFLPDGEILVTERPGRLVKIGRNRQVIQIKGVEHKGEGGLQGMALHPDFGNNRWIYLYLTTEVRKGLVNRVERYRFANDRLTNKKVVMDNIPGAAFHDGGRMAFGDDGLLYITTGDAGNPDSAQNIDSLSGKILRLEDDGTIPAENPFGNAVFSYGHRNPQGLAWDGKGRLWSTEHGRTSFSGGKLLSGFDEINFIKKGGNYGWPDIQGDEKKVEMTTPVRHSGADETWAPAGAAIVGDSLFFAGLRGESLYEGELSGRKIISIKAHFREQFGRLRAVRRGPDGFLYITTSNTDGRGQERVGDDKLIKINPAIF